MHSGSPERSDLSLRRSSFGIMVTCVDVLWGLAEANETHRDFSADAGCVQNRDIVCADNGTYVYFARADC